jgi:hypothetical protein
VKKQRPVNIEYTTVLTTILQFFFAMTLLTYLVMGFLTVWGV